jgi:hypothetical protein
MSRHSERASRALRKLAETDPAFASLSLWVLHEDSDAKALPAWSDGTTIRYGASFETFTFPSRWGWPRITSCTWPSATRHAPRRWGCASGAAHDGALFNTAADAVLNEALFRAGYVMPRPCVLLTDLLREALGETAPPDDALARWDAETLYVRLMARATRAGPARRPGRSVPGPRGRASPRISTPAIPRTGTTRARGKSASRARWRRGGWRGAGSGFWGIGSPTCPRRGSRGRRCCGGSSPGR